MLKAFLTRLIRRITTGHKGEKYGLIHFSTGDRRAKTLEFSAPAKQALDDARKLSASPGTSRTILWKELNGTRELVFDSHMGAQWPLMS